MFVKFDCDCVGLVVGNSEPIVIEPCDLNHPECWEPIQFAHRDMGEKTTTPLPPNQVAHYVKAIHRLIGDGYAFRKVQDLLAKPKD
jgi:hypothetical protein